MSSNNSWRARAKRLVSDLILVVIAAAVAAGITVMVMEAENQNKPDKSSE